MGMIVEDNLKDVLDGETLTAFDFDYNNEAIIYTMDADGNTYRHRISAALRDLLDEYVEIVNCTEGEDRVAA